MKFFIGEIYEFFTLTKTVPKQQWFWKAKFACRAINRVKGKAVPLQAWTGPEGSRRLRSPGPHISRQSAHEGGKVVSPTHRAPSPPGNTPSTHFCWRLSQTQGHNAAGRIIPMRNSNDTIGNRTRDLLTCSAVSQPTAPPRAPYWQGTYEYLVLFWLFAF